jgi:hypothetical protein
VAEGDVADRCLLSSVSELFDRERVMIAPGAPEFFQHVARGDLNTCADCELLVVRRSHRARDVDSFTKYNTNHRSSSGSYASRAILVRINSHSRATDLKSVSRQTRRKPSSA